jgi:hypothetical protein
MDGCENIASPHPRPTVCGEEPQPTRGDPVYAEHSGSKGINHETKNLQFYGRRTVPMGCMAVCFCVAKGLSRIPGDFPDVSSLTRHGVFAWWTLDPHKHGLNGNF